MKTNWRYPAAIIGLAVLALLVMDFNSRMAELSRLSREKEQVAAQVTDLAVTLTTLQTQIAYATSDQAVLEQAYEQGRLVRPGDVLVVPLAPPGSTPQPEPAPASTPVTYHKWQYWYALFFDRQP
jgi:hypothetical protein